MKKIYNNGIDCKYFEEGTQPDGWKLGACKIDYKHLFDLNEVLPYYADNSTQDTALHFNCKKEKLIKFLIENGIELHTRAEDVKFSNQKRINTCLATYGVTDVNKLPEVRAKIEGTNLEKYGAKTYMATDAFVQYNKAIQTERYGGMGCGSSEVGAKIRAATAEHFGTNCVFKLGSFVEYNKYIQRERYGGIGFESAELAKKGVTTALANNNLTTKQELNQLIKRRQEQSMLRAYGVRCFAQTPEFFKKLKKKYFYNDTYFDSIPELALYIYYCDNGIPIMRNTQVCFEFNHNDILHKYFPDFISGDELLEVKGDHFFDAHGHMCNPYDHLQDSLYEAKHQCGLQNGVKFITSVLYNNYIKYCRAKYNQNTWYNNFKVDKNGGDANEKNG